MSFAYDSDLESTDEELSGEFGDEYGGFFSEEDYAVGVDPSQPTVAKPGSEEKVLTLAARYAAGLPLWHNEDRYDHGPGQLEPAEASSRDEEYVPEEDEV